MTNLEEDLSKKQEAEKGQQELEKLPNKISKYGKKGQEILKKKCDNEVKDFMEKGENSIFLEYQDIMNDQCTKDELTPQQSSILGVIKQNGYEKKFEQLLTTKKIGQLKLLLETAQMYKEYLQDLLNNIKLGVLSDKPQRYKDQIKKIDDIIKKIQQGVTSGDIQTLGKINIEDTVNQVFISEPDIAQTGLWDKPFFNWGDGRFSDPRDMMQYTKNCYSKIRSMISSGDGLSDKFDDESLKKKRLEIGKLVRKTDSLDDDKHRYNSSEGVRKMVEGDVLEDKDLNKDEKLKKQFEFVKEYKNNPKLQKELLESYYTGESDLENCIIKFGFSKKLTHEVIEQVKGLRDDEIQKIENTTDENIKQEEKNQNRELNNEEKQKLKMQSYKLYYAFKVVNMFPQLAIKDGMDTNPNIKETMKSNELVNLYSEIEGIGGKTSDRTFNSRVDDGITIGSQIAMMYIAGLAQLGTRLLLSRGLTQTTQIVGKMPTTMEYIMSKEFLRAAGLEVGLIGSEGIAFYSMYEAQNSLYNNKPFKLDYKEAFKTSVFLGILRILPISKYLNNKQVNYNEKLPDSFIKKPLNLVLEGLKIGGDVGEVITTDIALRVSFGDGIPVGSWNEFGRFLAKEVEAIGPLVVGLRGAERTFKGGEIVESALTGNKHKIDMEILSNGDIKINGRSIEEIKKELRMNNQALDRNSKKKPTVGVEKERKGLHDERRALTAELKEKKDQNDVALPQDKTKDLPPIPQKKEKPKAEESAKEDVNKSLGKIVGLGIDLKNIKLEDVIKGFNLDTTTLEGSNVGKGFNELYSKMGEYKSLEELKSKSDQTIDKEFQRLEEYLDGLDVGEFQKKEIEEFKEKMGETKNKMKTDFMDAVKLKIDKKKFDQTYGDPKFMEKIMGLLVKKMNPELIDNIINHYRTEDVPIEIR